MPHILSYADADSEVRSTHFYDHSRDESDRVTQCIYCRSAMEVMAYDDLSVCRQCGWWTEVVGSKGFGWADCKWNDGKLKTYDIASLEVPLSELRSYLRRHPDDVAHVNPFHFERLVADCVKDSYKDSQITHVGGTRDRGIDFLLAQATGETWIVQVKRRANIRATEGVDAVRQLNGVLFREGAARGMVVTTAARFSPDAISETRVSTPTKAKYEMRLLAYPDLVDLFDIVPTEPYQPWKLHR